MRRTLVFGLVGVAVIATACSSSGSSSPSPSPSSTYCAQEAAVKDSYNALIGTDVAAEGTDALKTRFEAFAADLASLKSATGSRFSDQLDAVQSSVDLLKRVVDNADAAGPTTTAAQFIAGLGSLKTSIQALLTAVAKACGS